MNSSTTSSLVERLASIPSHLRINIIYSDDDIIVIHKPSLLRSVPGNRRKDGEHLPNPSLSSSPVNSSSSTIHNADVKNCTKRKRDSVILLEGDVNLKKSLTASQLVQQAWLDAITHYRDNQDNIEDIINSIEHELKSLFDLPGDDKYTDDDARNLKERREALKSNVKSILRNLASKSDGRLASIPRKYKSFKMYCRRNVKVILPHLMIDNPSRSTCSADDVCDRNIHSMKRQESIDMASKAAFEILRLKANAFNVLDAGRTKEEDSALGQLQLLRVISTREALNSSDDMKVLEQFGTSLKIPSQHLDPIYVVHRLDCETSGIMVFARNEDAAGKLSKAWRERDLVSKVYLARVKSWPPFHCHGHRDGVIDLPLAAMEDERVKWHVKEERDGGKPSKTLWKVLKNADGITKDDGGSIILELKPVTGRTHQLRVHCAAIGSGIEGDSLYGDEPVELAMDAGKSYNAFDSSLSLKLHAYRLSIPHPSTGQLVEFQSVCWWK